MERTKNAPALGTAPVGKLVFKLAVPAVVAQIINLLYNLVDRMYVGSIEGIGTDALAGLGVVFPIVIIVSAFGNLVGLGGAPLSSIFLGEKKREEAERTFNTGALLLVLFGVALTIVVLSAGDPLIRLFGSPDSSFSYASEYLFIYGFGSLFVMLSLGLNPFITAQGFSLTSMATVAIGAGLNIGLDPLFIFVFGMGVRGARHRPLAGGLCRVGRSLLLRKEVAVPLHGKLSPSRLPHRRKNAPVRALALYHDGHRERHSDRL